MPVQLAITPGEPAGIGPELILQLAAQPRASRWVVIADPALLRERAAALDIDVDLRIHDPRLPVPAAPAIEVLPVPLGAASQPGVLATGNAAYVLEALDRGIADCLQGRFDALVTGPVHKAVIADAGVPFSGHTERLAEKCGARDVLMMLTADDLRVALVTTHLPLSDVPRNITRARLETTLSLLLAGLRDRYGIARPRIGVCGLNPHAGEGGHLGREEIEVITPVCDAFREDGLQIVGPLPADTIFTPASLQRFDAVLAMYHDQGLPVLKHAGFSRAVNVTLGLPIIRTSVDHGTALDLAGTGRGDPGSLAAAIAAAEHMANVRRGAGARA